jgi:hypothetical protein
MPRILALLALAPLAALVQAADEAAPPAWSGMIAVSETINGPEASGGDQHELEHFAHVIEDRLHQARAELATAPPLIARVMREDVGFYEAELERVVAARGGALTIGRTIYFIKGDRMLVIADGARLLIDRAAGTATGMVDGQATTAKLQPLPGRDSLDGAPAGANALGYDTHRVSRHIKGRTYTIDVVPDLPNPYAIGLIENGQDSDLVSSLAELPGLPMLVSESSNEATRSLCVTGVDRRDIADSVFAP